MKMDVEVIDILEEKGKYEVIIGQGNFSVLTVDDLYMVMKKAAGKGEFAVAMNESDPKLVRVNGTNEELKKLAAEAALKIGAGHCFVIFMKDIYPINVLSELKHYPTVCNIYVATSNKLQVLTVETNLGKSIIGVADGYKMQKIENEEEKNQRRELVKNIGFGLP